MQDLILQENTTKLLFLRRVVSRVDMVGRDHATETPGAGSIAARMLGETEPVIETIRECLEGWVGR